MNEVGSVEAIRGHDVGKGMVVFLTEALDHRTGGERVEVGSGGMRKRLGSEEGVDIRNEGFRGNAVSGDGTDEVEKTSQ